MNPRIHSLYFSENRLPTTPHYHDCHQILFVTDGFTHIRIGASEHTLAAGSLAIISRFEEHSIFGASKDYRRYVLRLHPHVNFAENPRLFALLFNRPANFNNILQAENDAEEIRRLFDRLIHEFTAAPALADEMTDCLLNELLIFVSRHMSSDLFDCDGTAFSIVSNLQSLLSEEFRQSYTIQQLASRFCVSPSYLSHNFKRITGLSVMEFLFSCRIAEAKKLLTKTDLAIGAIVEECGFSDFSNFSRSFKKSTGVTPSAYAKRYKKTGNG